MSKTTRVIRTGGMAQAFEYLCRNHEALSSNPSITKDSTNLNEDFAPQGTFGNVWRNFYLLQ
jgi:hypothetical protein